MDALMDALGYASDALDKPGRAVRGVLAGKGREALAAVPFSDSLGITDAKQRTSGRDLTDQYGLTDKYDHSFGSSALGFGAEMLTDPLNLAAGYGAFRAAPTIAKGLKGAAGAISGLDLIGSLGRGAGKFLSRGAKPALLSGDDLADMIRMDRPLKRSIGFSDIDHNGEATGGYRSLRAGSKTLGNTYFGQPGPIETEAARRSFPDVVGEGDSARRVEGTFLEDGHQGKGLGQALYLDMMGQHPGDWFYNRNASDQANHAREALGKKGLIEHYADSRPGGLDPYVGRITDAGLEMLSHPDLLASLHAGKGFPSPMPMPPRRPLPPKGSPAFLERLLKGEEGAVLADPADWSGFGSRSHPDYVNNKTFYHGTGNSGLTADRLDPNVTDIQGLFGSGIYTTDSRKIAEGYAAARSKRSGTPSIYQAQSGFNNILDLDNPATRDFMDVVEHSAGRLDPEIKQAVQDAGRAGGTGADIYKAFRNGVSDYSHGEGVPLSEFYDNFGQLTDNFRKAGIDAFTHTGGLRTKAGQAHGPHQVVIGLDPNDFARVAPATPYRRFDLEQPGGSLHAEPALVNDTGNTEYLQNLKADPTRDTQPWWRAAMINAEHGVESAPMTPISWEMAKAAPGSAARYLPMSDRVQFNMGFGSKPNWRGVASPSIWQDSGAMKKLIESNFMDGHFSGFSPDHMAYHELGHALHRRSLGLDQFGQLGDEFAGNYKPLIKDAVSNYAATNPAELVAEIYAGLRGGRQFDPDKHRVIRSFMKDLAGTPMLDHLSNSGIGKSIGLSALLAAYGLSSPGEATPGA